ncbi:hypothetical protein [Bradyrhizobium yuanmingense]|uniref:hypothetical protein n=1 Tax=Bradyrhizobium yuanmingense TaxID=108015 RepID=UPI003511CE19
MWTITFVLTLLFFLIQLGTVGSARTYILSDPYTIGIVRATNSAPAAHLFSSLDTVNEMIATGAKSVVRTTLQPAEGDQRLADTCSLIAPLMRVVLHHSCHRRDKSC